MEKLEIEKTRKRFGLLGKNIAYSFSRGYFAEKFEKLQLQNHSYENFDIPEIKTFKDVLQEQNLCGLNVTIPYKLEVIPFLDRLDEEAEAIGAVNTIKFSKEGLIGFNTDCYGFEQSLKPYLKDHHNKALILGTGGASKAVAYTLKKLNIDFNYVSRWEKTAQLTYNNLTEELIAQHTLIINCTPLGTHPNIAQKPDLPYNGITENHLLYDLIYNPSKTAFLEAGEKRGASISNGLRMLELQAERAWEIWNS